MSYKNALRNGSDEIAKDVVGNEFSDYISQLQAVRNSSVGAHKTSGDHTIILGTIAMYVDSKSKEEKEKYREKSDN